MPETDAFLQYELEWNCDEWWFTRTGTQETRPDPRGSRHQRTRNDSSVSSSCLSSLYWLNFLPNEYLCNLFISLEYGEIVRTRYTAKLFTFYFFFWSILIFYILIQAEYDISRLTGIFFSCVGITALYFSTLNRCATKSSINIVQRANQRSLEIYSTTLDVIQMQWRHRYKVYPWNINCDVTVEVLVSTVYLPCSFLTFS